MIKEIHSHENDSKCYEVTGYGGRRLTKAGVYSLNGKEVFMAFNSYSWHWYAFDTTDGREIASFNNDFFEKYLKSYKTGELTPAPNCINNN